MFRNIPTVAALATALLIPTISVAAPVHAKRAVNRHWHGYGFLPGYPPARQDYYGGGSPEYWYGGPGFYRGRWNGGGFGPCWKTTPIGPMWICG